MKFERLYNSLQEIDHTQKTLLKSINDVDQQQFELSIKVDLRATYFQAIEALFEIIFALEYLSKSNEDHKLWIHLSTSDWKKNYSRIEKISKGNIVFLDNEIAWRNEQPVSLNEYIFYFGRLKQKYESEVIESCDTIKSALPIFACDFSRRDEYNAMKHSLRLFPTLTKFEMSPQESFKENKIEFDMSNSLTYLKKDRKDGNLKFSVIPLDTERNYRMGIFCSMLISNIIRTRRVHFYREKEHVYFFTKNGLSQSNKSSFDWVKFSLDI